MSNYTININVFLPEDATKKNTIINKEVQVHPNEDPITQVTVDTDTFIDKETGLTSNKVNSATINFNADQGDSAAILPLTISFTGGSNRAQIPFTSGNCDVTKTNNGTTPPNGMDIYFYL